MRPQSKGSGLFLNWRLCLQTSGIYRLLPSQVAIRFNRRGRLSRPSWSGPGVSAQGASLQSLILCSGQHQCRRGTRYVKAVVVVDREK